MVLSSCNNLQLQVSAPLSKKITNLDVLGELLIELLVVLLVLSQLSEKFQALLHQVLADHFQDLALLQHLTRNVQR